MTSLPLTATNLDTQIMNGSDGISYVANSWIIIQNSNSVPFLLYDSTPNIHHGSAANGATWKNGVDCIAGSCLNFDGYDNLITVPDESGLDFASTDSFTVTSWFKHPINDSGTDVLLAKYLSIVGTDGGYKIYMNPGGQ
jgi:hypothetical protein